MSELLKSKTLTISIDCDPNDVSSFVLTPENLPKWAKTFCRSIDMIGGEWVIETPQGSMKVRFAPKNDFGVMDHHVFPTPGIEIFVPFRVVPNRAGSEVIFTLFQQPGMSDENFEADGKLVEEDLNSLKKVLEG